MGQGATVRQGEPPADQWESVRCAHCRARLYDWNRYLQRLNLRCRRCGEKHAATVVGHVVHQDTAP